MTNPTQYRVYFNNTMLKQLQPDAIFSNVPDADVYATEQLSTMRSFVTEARILTYPTNALVMIVKRQQ
jgi:hypothetical protein